jgi:hypothetical protein
VNSPRSATTKTHTQPSLGPAHTVSYGGWRITLRVESVEWVGEDQPIPKPESERTLSVHDLNRLYRSINFPWSTTARYKREFAKGEGGMFAELHPFLEGNEWRIPLTAVRQDMETICEGHPERMPPASFWDEWGE